MINASSEEGIGTIEETAENHEERGCDHGSDSDGEGAGLRLGGRFDLLREFGECGDRCGNLGEWLDDVVGKLFVGERFGSGRG